MTRQGQNRIAIIGLGKIARDQHLPAILADGRFDLVATVDPVHALPDVPAFASIDVLASHGPALDAVAICTPPGVRADLARRAIAAGWHVMLEKPPATTSAEAQGLIEQADKAGVTLYAAWHSRMAGGVTLARDWLADRQVTGLSITWHEDIRCWHPGQDWLLAEGGFGVFDPAINAFSIVTAILPGPLRIAAAHLTVPAGRQAPVAAEIMLDYAGAPGRASLDFLHAGEPRWDIAVETTQGSLVLGCGGHRLEVEGGATDFDRAEYSYLYRAFADLIDRGSSDADLAPLRLIEASLQVATRASGPAFDWNPLPQADIAERLSAP
ncbi:D-galactose 1-dehydrogenase [Novosphingobium sp. CF614]|uniref:Gfo/Idh/MocA family protein n=1 Tax=Novosphingobium sp. CF614 TaxID=1884364 RepID=UPI0008F2B88C|nr:Gfo/Idh/MocA family oxidoreductase [Novosphingobium sp. CF614]SFF85383.1 D-galactose 1-dehydrogenase [Novosphingobium sp. CF614]